MADHSDQIFRREADGSILMNRNGGREVDDPLHPLRPGQPGYDALRDQMDAARRAPGSIVRTRPDGVEEVYTHRDYESQQRTMQDLRAWERQNAPAAPRSSPPPGQCGPTKSCPPIPPSQLREIPFVNRTPVSAIKVPVLRA